MKALKRVIPTVIRRWLRQKQITLRKRLLLIDRVTDFSQLRRTTPYRPDFGFVRGQCIDRFYIEKFLEKHAADIYGHVLEVHDSDYTRRFGGPKVVCSEVIDADAANSKATLFADITNPYFIPDDAFDCIICTQTLMFVYDFHAAIRNLHRILKPGGVLLATFPGIAQLCPRSLMGVGEDYWRFTRYSALAAFGSVFGDDTLTVDTYGNVLAAVGFLHGLVSEEFTREELEYNDPVYEVIIAVRTAKPAKGVQR